MPGFSIIDNNQVEFSIQLPFVLTGTLEVISLLLEKKNKPVLRIS